jgi:hypothetical protein
MQIKPNSNPKVLKVVGNNLLTPSIKADAAARKATNINNG